MTGEPYDLRYDGEHFLLSTEDHRRLAKIYASGLSISSVLFTFTPVGSAREVTLAVGGGARLILTRDTPAMD
ncbi:hypothetical protein GCM10009596_20800 [Arthrobacter rhombi]|uniref:hypothetical protein n=1 Tax=Arthrobacter rhombi TaxID=71253 RepID=UPI0031E1E4B8